jgi:hypothetical protein
VQQPDDSQKQNTTASEIVTQRLAQAIVEKQRVKPATNVQELQTHLQDAIQEQALHDFELIQQVSGAKLLEKLMQAQLGQAVSFTDVEAVAAGAFHESAIDESDIDTRVMSSGDTK